MSAIVPYQDMRGMAKDIASSGLFGMKNEQQVLALMAVAQAEGKHPAIVARDYDIIQGRPAKKAEAMLRDFLAGGGKVEWHQMDDDCADATFSHPAGGSVRITWDMRRAQQADLKGKDMYRKYPRQMLRSRTVSEGVRAVGPFATSGLYVPEEVREFEPADKNGKVIDAEIVTDNGNGQAAGGDETLTKEEAANVAALLQEVGGKDLFLRWCKVESIEQIKRHNYSHVIARLEEKRRES